MYKSLPWFVGALGFAIGGWLLIGLARPAEAQAYFKPSPYFPRANDLWSARANSLNYGFFPTPIFPSQSGILFTVAADASGRIPVLTSVHALDTSGAPPVYRKGSDGLYRYFLAGDPSRRHDLWPGVPLLPGDYAIDVGADIDEDVVCLIGYWAHP